MTEALLDVQGASKAYGPTVALREVDLAVAPGELVTLLGPSGSGKSTLLRAIAGFEALDAGRVKLRGRDVARMTPAEREVGMVFQHYALFPHMTVAGNVGYGLKMRGSRRAERAVRVREVIDLLRLAGYENRYPRQLSGGEQQRVALGRALAYDPEIVLMDEPLGALDRALRTELEYEIRRVHRDLGTTILYVTHDQREALALSDRVAVMRDGRIVEVGSPEVLYGRPRTSFVASFFGNANLLPVEAYESVGPGVARVRCLEQDVRCVSAEPPSGAGLLAVRPRSLRTRPTGGLRLAGTVSETLLLGDERQVRLDVPGAGAITALLDAQDSRGMQAGVRGELFVANEEAVLVSEDER
jgi:putative spermidine/putrescine transport system ATP-binding protein